MQLDEEYQRRQADREYRQRVFGPFTRETCVPSDFQTRLRELMAELEHATHCPYTLTLRQAGRETAFIIGDLAKRQGYAVSEARPGYEPLNGHYASLEEVQHKVLCLKYGAALQLDAKSWRCAHCGESERKLVTENGREWTKRNIVSSSFCSDVCQFCSLSFSSPWNNISFDLATGEIYTSSGGRMSVCHPVAKITVLLA